MSNYTHQKFRLGTVWGRLWGQPLGPPLELLLVGGIAPMLLGDRCPCISPITISSHKTKLSRNILTTLQMIIFCYQ